MIRKLASKWLPHHGNPKLTAPPAAVPLGSGKPVLVKSLMRSGTHLLIDLILNNFPQLRTSSLYVELDHAALKSMRKEAFEGLGTCVCKTHYDGIDRGGTKKEIVDFVRDDAYIIGPVRCKEDMKRSLEKFIPCKDELKRLVEEMEEFDRYWDELPGLKIAFEDLVTKAGNDRAIEQIAEYIGERPSKKRYYNRSKSETKLVLLDKLLTRLRGPKQRRVNTTIAFNG